MTALVSPHTAPPPTPFLLPSFANFSLQSSLPSGSGSGSGSDSKTIITIVTDVSTPVTGPEGCTFTFAQQKGLPVTLLPQLDSWLENLLVWYETELNQTITGDKGAAGALGVGIEVWSNKYGRGRTQVEWEKGIELVFRALELDKHLEWAEIVITGEGRVDKTSKKGKVVGEVLSKGISLHKKLIVLCGMWEMEEEEEEEENQKEIQNQWGTTTTTILTNQNSLVVGELRHRFGETLAKTETASCLEQLVQEILLP